MGRCAPPYPCQNENTMAEIFTPINRKVGELLTDVASGRIGLPDLQRPFVWKDSKVRNLLDSNPKGFTKRFINGGVKTNGFVKKKQNWSKF